MSDLQDALEKYYKTGSAYGNVKLFADAARLVANASTVAFHRFDGGMWEFHAVDGLEGEPDATHLLIALTPGDTDGE